MLSHRFSLLAGVGVYGVCGVPEGSRKSAAFLTERRASLLSPRTQG